MNENINETARVGGRRTRKGTRKSTGGSGNGSPSFDVGSENASNLFNFGAEFAEDDPEEILHELPVEEVLLGGPGEHEKKSPTRRISARNFLPYLQPVWDTIAKQPALESIAYRQRLVGWHGMAIILNLDGLKEARTAVVRDNVELSGLQLYRRRGRGTYQILDPLLLLPDQHVSTPRQIAVSSNTGDAIDSLAALLHMPASLILKLAVAASFATSVKWVRKDFKKICEGEIDEFNAWLATGFDIPGG